MLLYRSVCYHGYGVYCSNGSPTHSLAEDSDLAYALQVELHTDTQ